MRPFVSWAALVAVLVGGLLPAQEVRVRPAERVAMPTTVDSNSPAFWRDGKLFWFGSHGRPWLSEGPNQFGPFETREVDFQAMVQRPHWMEAVWVEDNGVLWGWYHTEPIGLVEGSTLTAPKIGAVVSYDGGKTLRDLGIVLESGAPLRPDSKNGYFAGGHGDFSVILNRERTHFYFLFDNYGGPDATQGVVVARMAFEDRANPVGKVWKYKGGAWTEPGLGGEVTPFFPVRRPWQESDPDAFWGPSVHWNTHLRSFVMLLNRAQGEPGWSQEGVYVSFNTDLSRPENWSAPVRILDRSEFPGWYFFYPQVMGLGDNGTDTRAGATARLYVGGVSRWELDFIPRPSAPYEVQIETANAGPLVAAGAAVTLSAAAAGSGPMTYQWMKDGLPLAGATQGTLTIAAFAAGHAGDYAVAVSNSLGTAVSPTLTLGLRPPAVIVPIVPPAVSYLTNLSVRTALPAPGSMAAVGYVVSGTTAKPLLLRAVGPSLGLFGIAGGTVNPWLEVFDASGQRIARNDDWLLSDAPVFAAQGAFPLPVDSADAALALDVAPGVGTAQVRGGEGIVLLEIYDRSPAESSRILNLSARAHVGLGDAVLIGGFNLAGTGSKRLLVRALGPKLAEFGVDGGLPDPQLEIRAADGSLLASNDDWESQLAPTFSQAGATGLAAGARDAAVVVTLAAGRTYSAIVRAGGGLEGEAVLELFELP